MEAEKSKEFKCTNCGAPLKFEPGTESLKCPYCGTENIIQRSSIKIEEIDYKDFLANKYSNEELQEILLVKCSTCGAEVTLRPNITSDECPFCGSGLVVADKKSKKIIKPKSLLPFKVTKKESQEYFKKWLGNLWFAPNKLSYYARSEEGFQGVYMPFWTYDCETTSDYIGQRGEDYYVTETYTDTDSNGRSVTKTRQVLKTRWYSASGRVHDAFDDVLVIASNSLPRNYSDALEPWDLTNLVPYKDEYLTGFRSESYQVPLEEGFEYAKKFMAGDIEITIRDDIGGDRQQINNVRTQYDDITFKHILLPVWISAYRYQNKVYRFMINARTGEVQGERPYSKVKIALAVIAALVIISIIILFSGNGHSTGNYHSTTYYAPSYGSTRTYKPKSSYKSKSYSSYHRSSKRR